MCKDAAHVTSDVAWSTLNKLFCECGIADDWLMVKFRPACAELRVPPPWAKASRMSLQQAFASRLRALPHSKERAEWGLSLDDFLDLCVRGWLDEEARVLHSLEQAISDQQAFLSSVQRSSEDATHARSAPAVKELTDDEVDSLLRIWEGSHRQNAEAVDFEAHMWGDDTALCESLRCFAPVELRQLLKQAIARRQELPSWQAWDWDVDWEWRGVVAVSDEGVGSDPQAL
jgi:hypothetical protein